MAIILHDPDVIWKDFFIRQRLSDKQQQQFQEYYTLLIQTNKLHNITAITDLSKVIYDHFDDSLALRPYLEQSGVTGLGDIGSGAGFPGVPLKLIFPELPLVLIEVNAKKRAFLHELVLRFNLKEVTISEYDWRTFLRKTAYPLNLFCARASLQPEELLRMFMPTSSYKTGRLVYWASHEWRPLSRVKPFITHEISYSVGAKKRRLIFFEQQKILS